VACIILKIRLMMLQKSVVLGSKLHHGYHSHTKTLMNSLWLLILLVFQMVLSKLQLTHLKNVSKICAIFILVCLWAVRMVALAMILFTSNSLSLKFQNTVPHSS
jgi:hypothetical protein